MLKKSLVIATLALSLGIFLYFQPFIFAKEDTPRIIDRLPDADFIGRVNLLDLVKETNDLLYYYKTPFRDLTSADYILGQGKTFGLNLQNPLYIFGDENGEWGALIQLDDAEKAKLGIERLKQYFAVQDSSKSKTMLYFIPKLKIYLHLSANYLLVYSGKKVERVISRVQNAKYNGITNIWKEFLAISRFKNEHLVIYSKWKKLNEYGIEYALLAHDSDSTDFNVKYYFHKQKAFPFSNKKNGLSFSGQAASNRSIDLHLDAEEFRNSKNSPLKKLLIAKGKRLSFPSASFLDAWDGVLSFVEGGKQQVSERIIVSEMDEDFNVTQVEKYRTIDVPGYSLLFNTNDKGPAFINTLLQKGIMRSEGNQFRILFSPLLNMKKKGNYYFFYSGLKCPKTVESDKNDLLWPINKTNYYFKIDTINQQSITGTIKIPATNLTKNIFRAKSTD
jgi:hypothetical protein